MNMLGSIFIFFFFEYVYVAFVFEYYEYRGFTYTFNPYRYMAMKVVFFMVLFTVHRLNIDAFTYAVLNIFMVLSFMPNLIIYQFMPEAFVELPILNVLLIFTIIFFSKVPFPIHVSAIQKKDHLLLILLGTVLILIPFLIDFGFRMNFKALLLKDIYDSRAEASSAKGFFSRYLFSMVTKAFFPVIMIYGMLNKRYLLTLLGFVAMIYLFLINPHKTVLFSTFVIFAFTLGKDYNAKVTIWLTTVIVVLIIGRIATVYFDFLMIESLFARRTFFVKAFLNVGYYDVFQGNPIYLSNSILSRFIEYPYDLPPANLVAGHLMNSPETHSNNGFFSTGFMNFGIPGAIGNVLFISFLVALIKQYRLHPIYFGVIFILTKTLLSSSLLTTILTHGWLLFFIMLIFIISPKFANGTSSIKMNPN